MRFTETSIEQKQEHVMYNQPEVSANTPNTTSKPLGMAWYKFLIYFSLIFGAVINFFTAICFLTGSIYASESNGQITAEFVYAVYGSALQIVDIIYGILMIGFAVLVLMLRNKLANYSTDALKYVYIVYSLTAVAPLVYASIVSAITSQPIATEAIATLVVGVPFLFLNVKYFKKRAHLFTSKNTADQQSAPTSMAPTNKHSTSYSPNRKLRYCSHCGKIIDHNTKKCTGCGKQYFRGIPWKLLVKVALILMLITSCVFNYYFYNEIKSLESENEVLEKQVDVLTNDKIRLERSKQYLLADKNNLINKIESYSSKISFFDQFIVFVVDDGTKLYHTYDCSKFGDESFWAYNISAAENKGYKPCSLCHKAD